MFSPTLLDLRSLFREPSMFDSAADWRKQGFEVAGRGAPSDIMVASHPSAPGYLFKKYNRKVSLKDQRKNYLRRIEGADKLLAFVAERSLSRITAPQKYLHELSAEFSRKGVPSYVLVVERLSLLDGRTSKQRYHEMDEDFLRELCAVLLKFQGLDSGIRNMPFTEGGQVAFVDTERWQAKKGKPLKHLREYLTDAQKKILKTFL